MENRKLFISGLLALSFFALAPVRAMAQDEVEHVTRPRSAGRYRSSA